MSVENNVTLLQELISCEGNVYTWCYDTEGQLLHSNCPQEMLFNTAFSLFGCKDTAFLHAREYSEVIIPGTAMGMVWAAAFEKEDGLLKRVYVIGPVITTEASMAGIERTLKHYGKLEASLTWKNEFLVALETLPVVSNLIFTRFAVMLHYCVTGQKIGTSDIYFSNVAAPPELADMPQRDRHKTWQSEQVLLRMVREGDLNYQNAITASSLLSNGVPVKAGDPLRQIKDSVIVFTSLCTRAAIEGGLSPELAYTLGDSYIQNAEDAATTSDLSPIAVMMYSDFVHRVRKCRTNPKVSRQIQNCLDYIEIHVGEKLTLSALAQVAGYTEYYLSRKFKAEMRCTLGDYIKYAKIERAKELLTTTEQGIQAITESLGFCSRSYFSMVFSKIVGCAPAVYRTENKRI